MQQVYTSHLSVTVACVAPLARCINMTCVYNEHACLSPPWWSTALISSLLLLCRAPLQNTNSAGEPETQHLAPLRLRLLLFSSFIKCIIGDCALIIQLAVLYLQICACASYSFMHVQEQLICFVFDVRCIVLRCFYLKHLVVFKGLNFRILLTGLCAGRWIRRI